MPIGPRFTAIVRPILFRPATWWLNLESQPSIDTTRWHSGRLVGPPTDDIVAVPAYRLSKRLMLWTIQLSKALTRV